MADRDHAAFSAALDGLGYSQVGRVFFINVGHEIAGDSSWFIKVAVLKRGRSGITEGENKNIYAELILFSYYPDLFNSQTAISCFLRKRLHFKLTIYNIFGQEIVTMADSYLSPGYQLITWKADNLNSGIYYIDLSNG